MAAAVATMVVGPLVKIVMQKASNSLLDQYKVMKGMEEQHEIVKRKLPAIMDIIADAEQAAAHREGAAAWLGAIKKVAYQANEVFDEFKYEALRRKARKEGHYRELGFDVVKLFPTHNRFVFRNRMGRKLRKIVQAIEILVAEMNAFHFKYQQQPLLSNQLREMDHVIFDPNQITSKSRDTDNKKLVDILVGQANSADLTVVPIVGMGGLGKTTLAQLVYNEPVVQKHFDLLLWVSVSDSFDLDSLATSIVEAAPKDHAGTETAASKKTPLYSLQKVVSGQRYLLVLDDVWNREIRNWEKLKASLQHGGMGSVVLTTTRDEGVAEIMCTIEAYNLTALEDQYIKEIIEIRAFSCFQRKEDRPPVLVNVVGDIVKRCRGSPLAATALGSVLRTKTSEEEWRAISSRSSICTDESGILPILKLSYNDLPPQMKQCFAFCAIFPKDYEIDVDKLIQLWIAHGFLQEKQVRLETIGKQIFNELASRSFFQDVKQVQTNVMAYEYTTVTRAWYSKTTCKIHDLMHDVALSVMEKECVLATEEPEKIEGIVASEDQSPSGWLPNTARHLFLSCKEPGRKLNSSLVSSSPAIQTLLCDSYMYSSLQHLPKYSSLQALQLCSGRTSFPLKAKHLHHLRYLDLSRSNMKALPEDMSILYNLQTLNLSGCEYLSRLPKQLKYMTALRHLYTHGCPELKSMPRELGKLTSLQTLTCFVAGSGPNCSNVSELRNLNIGGQLELDHMANVTEEDAKEANLGKKELRELTLKWIVGRDCPNYHRRGDENDARVLENLKPHDRLHAIRIHSYGATTFPTWMAMLHNIVEIHLFHCEKLQWLFSHDHATLSFAFPNLKELTLQELACLERWWEVNNGLQREEIIFPRLEKLDISRCGKLTALPGQPTFPNLQHVRIQGCPELRTAAKSPNLSVLDVEGCEAELSLWVSRHMTSLTNLKLKCLADSTETTSATAECSLSEVVDNKENWNDHDFPLAVLVLRDFKSGIKLCACFVHLQDLSIWGSHALIHWPEKEFEGLASLRKLLICDCKNLRGYAQPPAKPSLSSEMSQLLPCLQSLILLRCQSLVELFNLPTSLRKMQIHNCSKLESTFGRRLQQGQLATPIHQESSSIQELSLSLPGSGTGAEHLEALELFRCDGLTGVLHLPPSLKELDISCCDGLTCLESRSGVLPLLERLALCRCKALSSLPDGPQEYSSLQYVTIRYCPGIKTLPTSLQERLGSIRKFIDAHYYGNKPTLLKPNTWKYALRKD